MGKSPVTGGSAPRSNKRPRPAAATDDGESSTGAEVILGDMDVLDCPICCEPLRPPVFQCDNGHLACNSCCTTIRNRCPACSLPVGFIRNRAIERVVETAKTACEYTKYGCSQKINYLNKQEHQKSCRFAPVSCPNPGCNYVGTHKSLYKHLYADHPRAFVIFTFGSVEWMSVGGNREYVFLVEMKSNIVFVLHRVVEPRGSVLSVHCVAPSSSDVKFLYELTAQTGEKSITLKTKVLLTPKWNIKTVAKKENSVVITDDFLMNCSDMLGLELTITEVSS